MPSEPPPVPRIFVSYRREDAPSAAGRLCDRLQERFGKGNVFIDIDTIQPGDDFAEIIQRTLAQCDFLIAVIGRRWLTVANDQGTPRLSDERDFVRLEIETALQRNVRTIPVLVEHATMPREQDLPPSLHPLARRQAVELTNARWSHDVSRLENGIARAAFTAATEPTASMPASSAPHGSAPVVDAEPPSDAGSERPPDAAPRGSTRVQVAVAASVIVTVALFAMIMWQTAPPGTPGPASGSRPPEEAVPPKGVESQPANEASPCGGPDPAAADLTECASACEDGRSRACYSLGLLYAQGRGVPADADRARRLYERSCRDGVADGCNALAIFYEMGTSVSKDDSMAAYFYDRGCTGGHLRACATLGVLYMDGRGRPKDQERAASLFQQACSGGDAYGCGYLRKLRGQP